MKLDRDSGEDVAGRPRAYVARRIPTGLAETTVELLMSRRYALAEHHAASSGRVDVWQNVASYIDSANGALLEIAAIEIAFDVDAATWLELTLRCFGDGPIDLRRTMVASLPRGDARSSHPGDATCRRSIAIQSGRLLVIACLTAATNRWAEVEGDAERLAATTRVVHPDPAWEPRYAEAMRCARLERPVAASLRWPASWNLLADAEPEERFDATLERRVGGLEAGLIHIAVTTQARDAVQGEIDTWLADRGFAPEAGERPSADGCRVSARRNGTDEAVSSVVELPGGTAGLVLVGPGPREASGLWAINRRAFDIVRAGLGEAQQGSASSSVSPPEHAARG